MMVHRYDDSSLLLVLQIDHSRLAGYLAAHWGNHEFAAPLPFASMVVAAQEHDSGWWNWEIKPSLNPEGLPPDYQRFWMSTAGVVADSEERAAAWVSFYRDGIDRVHAQDPYAGLLVLMHGTGLLCQGHGVRTNLPKMAGDPTAQAFLKEREALRLQMLEKLRKTDEYREYCSEEHLWRNFKLLEVFDQLSQFLSNRYPLNNTSRQTGPKNAIGNVPVAPGKADTTLNIEVQDERNAVIRPWPFDTDELELSYPARTISNRPYPSRDAFLKDFYAARPITVSYTLHQP
jgi:hypothetical protein